MRSWISFAVWVVLVVAFSAGAQQTQVGLEIAEEYIFLTYQQDTVGVYHIVDIVNPSAWTVSPIALPVIAGAREIQFEEGTLEVVIDDGRIEDRSPLPPEARRRYTLRYVVPSQSSPFALQRELRYPVDLTMLWADADHYRLTGLGIRLLGAETVGDIGFNVYRMQSSQSDLWQVTIEPAGYRNALPALNNFSVHGDPMEFIVGIGRRVWDSVPLIGLAVGVLIIVGAVLTVRRNRWRRRSEKNQAIVRLQELMIDLETQFRKGEVDEITYRQKRQRLKDRILSLMVHDALSAPAVNRKGSGVRSGA